MYLTCRECSTSYEVPLKTAPEQKKVRCSVCTHIWVATEKDWSDTFETDQDTSLDDEQPIDEIANDPSFAIDEVMPTDPSIVDLPEELDFTQEEAPPVLEDQMADLPEEDAPEDDDNNQDDIDSLFDSSLSEETLGEIKAEPEDENNQDDIDNLFGSGDEEEPAAGEIVEAPTPEPAPASSEAQADVKDDLEALETMFGVTAAEEPSAPKEADGKERKAKIRTKAKKTRKPSSVDVSALLPSFVSPHNAGWAAYGLGLLLGLTLGYSARVSIVKTIPATAGLYAMLGIDVNIRGIHFQEIAYTLSPPDKPKSLTVTGVLKNLTNEYKTIPPLKIIGMNGTGNETFQWMKPMPETPIYPLKNHKFTLTVPAPPPMTKSLQVYFAN